MMKNMPFYRKKAKKLIKFSQRLSEENTFHVQYTTFGFSTHTDCEIGEKRSMSAGPFMQFNFVTCRVKLYGFGHNSLILVMVGNIRSDSLPDIICTQNSCLYFHLVELIN